MLGNTKTELPPLLWPAEWKMPAPLHSVFVGGVGSFLTQIFFAHFLLPLSCLYIYPSGKISLGPSMSRKKAKIGPEKYSNCPFYTVKMGGHNFWDAPFRTILKLVSLLLKCQSNYATSPCNALLRTFLIWSSYWLFLAPKWPKSAELGETP